MSLDITNINNTLDAKSKLEDDGILNELKKYGLDKVKSFSRQVGQIGEKTKSLFSGALNIFKKKVEQPTEENFLDLVGTNDIKDTSKDKKEKFLNIEKGLEALANNRDTLTEELVTSMETISEGKIDQADWYEVGNLKAEEALNILKQILNRRIEGGSFNEKTKKWIEESINIFRPTSGETFTEYIERRFMKGNRLPGIYNDVVNVVSVFNDIDSALNNTDRVVDRQMIGEMPIEQVLNVLRENKNAQQDSGIRYILNNNIEPIKGESLRRYFYRLAVFNRGYLREDGSIDKEGLRADSDFQDMVRLLVDIVPKMHKRILLGGTEENIDYYQHYNPRNNSEDVLLSGIKK